MGLNFRDGFTLWIRLRSEQRLRRNLHSQIIRDGVTRWVESVSFSIVTKDWHIFLVIHLGFVAFSVVLAVCALVLSYSALGYVHLRLGWSLVECSSLLNGFFSFILCGFGYPGSPSSCFSVRFSSWLRRLLVWMCLVFYYIILCGIGSVCCMPVFPYPGVLPRRL